jgi:hypothetical protein
MYKQLEYLREGVTMTRGATYREDLPDAGMLSALLFKLSAPCASNASLAVANWRLQDYLGTLEVIANGATIIKSLDWKNAAFYHFLRTGVTPLGAWRNYATNTQFEYLLLMFGRFPGDPSYGLDLSKYDNVEVRLTNSASSTYYGSDITASIMQLWLRDHAGGFQGHIRSEKWREWTTVSDETKYFTLPSEYPISNITLRAVPPATNGVADTGFANMMDDIDFSIQGGTRKLYKGGLDDLALMDYYMKGKLALTSGLLDKTADYGAPVSLGRILGWATASGSKDGAVSSTVPTIEADSTDGYIKPEAREADSPIEFITMGYAFQESVALLDAPNLEPDLMLVPQQVGPVLLNVHTRSGATYAGGTAQVVLERVVA